MHGSLATGTHSFGLPRAPSKKSYFDPVSHCLGNVALEVALETKANFSDHCKRQVQPRWRQESCMVGEKAKREVISSRKYIFLSDM